MTEWDIAVGAETSRAELGGRFGGNAQAGIMNSATTPNVMLLTDHEKAAAHGYDFDGWVGDLYQYTAHGKEGDQTWTPSNARVRDHRSNGDAIRVFVAHDDFPGTSTRRQTYLGEFEVDLERPYELSEAPDRYDDLRSVIVFRLRPRGDVLRRTEDNSAAVLSNGALRLAGSDDPVTVIYGDVESGHVERFERGPTQSLTGTRRESGLVLRYKAFVEELGHIVSAPRFVPPGSVQELRTDLLDETDGELIEAKSESTRPNIRYAIGQLLDYGRRIDHLNKAVLLPTRPSEDLVDLLHRSSMACIHETGFESGVFTRIDSI